ncbi:dihydrodipicolinate synthase family protein [Tolumonas osonensis]|uniref:4-hydroxy-tetrahydrodipicolinate synthase n=1 Tax=Tolumonas osonensis TaxID=675874 RepID=A0A841GBK0_9GAMM|nr:dihydrodipicolinate synthase family protein [Tolumonas osonensis]MBB6056514.1 4-hydroxy-tetrahydrodipicolinate synthase [Tolumonas osonensis]
MSIKKFSGVIPPVSSAFDNTGNIDYTATKAIADYLITSGVNGLFYLGSGGEFSQMNHVERMKLAEAAIEVTAHRVPVLIGVGSTNTREAVELTKHAEKSGADAVVVINPFYWKVTEKNLLHYFQSIASATDLPVLLYNFPLLTGQDLTPEFVKNLALKHNNIVGIKDTIDSVTHIRNMINIVKEVRPDFSVLCGYDDHLLSTLLLGGDGSITASINFAPELSVGIYQAFQQGDLKTAAEMHKKLIQMPSVYGLDTPFIALIKEAMKLKGLPINTYCLPPTQQPTDEMKSKLKQFLLSHGILK